MGTLEYRTAGEGRETSTREKPFLTPEYRHALAEAGLFMVRELPIRDDYYVDTSVIMMIARKPFQTTGDW